MVIADDELDLLESTKVLLEMEGHEVVVVSDARDVLAAVRHAAPDVLLQDVHMPDLDLAHLVAALRADEATRGVAIVLFTAAPHAEALLEKWGADDVVRKPFEVEELLAMLEKWSGARR